jgi:hypothetical protein
LLLFQSQCFILGLEQVFHRSFILCESNLRRPITVAGCLQLPPCRPLDLPIPALKHRSTRHGSSIRRCDQFPYPVPRAHSLQNPHNLIGSATEATLASTAWLVRFRPRLARANAKARWLTPEGAFSSDSARALIVSTPQAAAERLQMFVDLKG